jgi:oligopeptide/dipeptide ABC transporter ATP-binding protein
MTQETLLEVQELTVAFATEQGELRAVEQMSFLLQRGQVLGIVGESGCGKSVTALSIMRLLPRPAGRVVSGRVLLDGLDLLRLPARELTRIRGRRIAMIFQEPMTSLNPVQRIGAQLTEVFRLHYPALSQAQVHQESLGLLRRVGIPEPAARLAEYPHQISGGMRQRVMIAMALACRPEILIADEPTTALDVTIQAQILDLILGLRREHGMSVILITHALGVVAETCDAVVVMYAGLVAETAPVTALFATPAHPYTQGLLRAMPRLETPRKSELPVIPGVVPALGEFPAGCRFQNRCPRRMPICGSAPPPLFAVGPQHAAACFLHAPSGARERA